MMRGMYSAISGLKSHQSMLDVTANDIANVNTVGYKGGRTTFTDQLSQLQRGAAAPGAGTGGSNPAQVGLGVQIGSIDSEMGTGSTQTTGNVLDMAIQGGGWFRVTTVAPADPASAAGAPNAAEGYTRAGNFSRNSQGFLVTQQGAYVLGKTAPGGGGADSYLLIPDDASNLSIAPDGQVSYIPAAGGNRVTAGYVSLAGFANEAGLERASGNLWRVSPASGTEVPASGTTPGTAGLGRTLSGVVEMSNVDLATEFTSLISAQRGFQANSRVISTSDEMLQDLVNLKR